MRRRNTYMRAWVASPTHRDRRFLFVDFAALGSARHPPPAAAQRNWHYMCFLNWQVKRWGEVGHTGEWDWVCPGCTLAKFDHSNGTRGGEQVPQGTVERVHTTEDGQCRDEVNRNLWNAMFTVLMQTMGPPPQ